MPTRRRDPISVPRTFHSSSGLHHDYGIDDSISRAGYFSNAVLQDTDDAAARSRGKDYDLLRSTHNAIIDTEMHATPRATVASMRARASSVPPKVLGRPARLQQQLHNRPKSAIYGDPIASSGLHATRPSYPKPAERKPIRNVDGFTKPKNVMSWEHRVESRLSPDDLLYTPSSFGRMRDQVRSAQDKMDRHRQLLDRYLDPDMKPASSIVNHNSRGSPSSSAGGDPDNAPMSDLRRRLRRTLAKTKNNPDYYKE